MSGMHRQQKSHSWKTIIAIVVVAAVALIGGVIALQSGGKSDHHHSSVSTGVGTASVPTSSGTLPIQVQPVQRSAESKAQTSSPASKPTTRSAPVSPRVKVKSTSSPTLIYVVHKGDCLICIAKWFHSHGYMSLYKWNKKLIGNNPNLIYPGQRLIVVPGSSTQKVVNH